MNFVRGIVLKTKRNSAILLTPDGEFTRVSPARGRLRRGREVYMVLSRRPGWPAGVLVASVILVVAAGLAWSGLLHPRPSAYIAFEINPGVELACDRSLRVIAARGLDAAGTDIAQSLGARLPLRTAVEELVEACIHRGYLVPGSADNVVLSAVSAGGRRVEIAREVEGALREALSARGVGGCLAVEPVGLEVRQKARQLGMSFARYALVERARRAGVDMGPEEALRPLREILRDIGVPVDVLFERLPVPFLKDLPPGRPPGGKPGGGR